MKNSAQIERNRANARRRYYERKAKRLCIYCDEPADAPHVRCKIHREIVSDYSAGVRDIRKLKGLCAECGKRKPAPERVACQECLERFKQNNQKRKNLKKDSPLE